MNNGTNPFDPSTNHLVSVDAAGGYEARGMVTKLGVGPTVTMQYDAEGNMKNTAYPGSGPGLTWIYDAEGQRAQQRVDGGSWTLYIHDAFGQLAATYNNNGVTPVCTTCYLTYDMLGSVRLVTDANQNVVARHDFIPFGEEIPDGTAGRVGNFAYSSNVTQAFTGQEEDGGNAALHYFNARHLSGALGSFMQPDPGNAGAILTNPQSWNGYAYVGGNPLTFVDPTGMWGKDPSGIDDGDCFEASNPTPCSYPGDGWDLGTGGNIGGMPSTPPAQQNSPPLTAPSSAVPFSCDLYGCWGVPQMNLTPTIGPCVFAPSGSYNVKPGVNLRFESATASHLSSAISVMNTQGVTPTITDGFRTAIDQAIRLGDPRSITPAKINQSLHQSGSAVDIRIDQNSGVVNSSMTNAGFTWGGKFSRPDPVHYQMGLPGSRPNPATAKACGGWQF